MARDVAPFHLVGMARSGTNGPSSRDSLSGAPSETREMAELMVDERRAREASAAPFLVVILAVAVIAAVVMMVAS